MFETLGPQIYKRVLNRVQAAQYGRKLRQNEAQVLGQFSKLPQGTELNLKRKRPTIIKTQIQGNLLGACRGTLRGKLPDLPLKKLSMKLARQA